MHGSAGTSCPLGHDPGEHTLPLAFGTVVGEQGTLSGGQGQRLAFARTLLANPELLLMDDTTRALDARTEARIMEPLKKVLDGRTSLAITHRVAAARADNRAGYDRDG